MTRLLDAIEQSTALDAALLLGLTGAALTALSIIWSRE